MQNNKLTIDHIRDILVKELDIDGERVNMYNQKFIIPPVDGLFIYVSYKGTPQVISSRNAFSDVAGQATETQDVNTQEDLAVSLFSKNLEALTRKEEVVMAIASIYSQQVQEAQNFKIFGKPSIADLSYLEGAAMLNRVDIDIRVMAWYQKVKKTDYMTGNLVSVRVNDGQPDLTADVDVSEQP